MPRSHAPDRPTPTPTHRDPSLTAADLNHPIEPVTLNSTLDTHEPEWATATQELVEALPQRWSRGLLYSLMLFCAIALPWGMITQVDEIGTARGRIEPRGKTVRLDAQINGTIGTVHVKEGQSVRAGQTLVELKSDLNTTEIQQIQARLDGHRTRLTQFQLVKQQLAATARTQRLQHQAQIAEQVAQLSQIQQRLQASRTAYQSAQAVLAKDRRKVDRYRSLEGDGIIAKVQVEDTERTMLETIQRTQQAQSEIQQTQSELQKQRSTYDRILREGELVQIASDRQLQELQAQILGIQAEISQTQSQLKSLRLQQRQHIVKSPMEGRIFQLAIAHPGAVVQSGQTIAQVAPKTAPLIVRAQMRAQDSGFLRVGLPVKLKFDAYPFQEYGIVSGTVRWVSPDSKVIPITSSQPGNSGQEEVFELDITLDQSYVMAGNKRIPLTPGQTASADVIIRQRRLIDFFLDPFRKLHHGGLTM